MSVCRAGSHLSVVWVPRFTNCALAAVTVQPRTVHLETEAIFDPLSRSVDLFLAYLRMFICLLEKKINGSRDGVV